jgi:hypothetical protein
VLHFAVPLQFLKAGLLTIYLASDACDAWGGIELSPQLAGLAFKPKYFQGVVDDWIF